ncbi:hypothetical protein Pst134EB_006534 [Puccinia striiformis f. sp. tritici]|nr:hypothetical protein Pst134EB_006534 [Puccinia striiformis f. sp. tritici]
MSNLHTALVTPSKAMSSKSSIFSVKYPLWFSIIIILLFHLPSSSSTTSFSDRQSELWSRARLRARAVDFSPAEGDCPGPNCKTTNAALSVAGGSAQGNTKDIHHRAKISTRTKSSRSLRVRDCTLEGPKKDSPTPGKFGETKGPGKVKEKHKKPASAPKEEKPIEPKAELAEAAPETAPNENDQTNSKSVGQVEDHSQPADPKHKHKSHAPSKKNIPTTPTPTTPTPTTPTPTTPTPSTPNPTSPEKPVPDTGDDSSKWLTAHNDIRKRYNAPPLVWDPKLAATAQGWANRCYFEHSKSGYGENIAAGYPTIESVVQDWAFGTDECPSWDPANPDYSHFTQVVWATAATLGCGVKNCATLPGVPFKLINANFWVCNYGGPPDAPTDFKSNMHASAHQCLKG